MIDKNKLEYFFFASFTKLFKTLGLKKTRKLGKAAGTIIYCFIPLRKQVVLNNLTNAFPQKNRKEIKEIALRNYQSIAITFFEFMYFPSSSVEEIASILEVCETESAKKLLADKKSFVFLSAHFGNWELSAMSWSVKCGRPFHVLAQPQRNPYVTEWLTSARESFGNKVIYLGVSVRHLIEAIKNNEIVVVAGDQRGPVESPRISFLGIPTAYHLGTAAIILKTKSSVVVGFCLRQRDNNYKMQLETLDLEGLPQDKDEQAVELQRRYIQLLEKYVKLYPEQYFWMHKIWKY